jgi:hypothetical protein
MCQLRRHDVNVALFDISENGQIIGVSREGRAYFNQFVTELPETRLLDLGSDPRRVMLAARTQEEAMVELGVLKASMKRANNPNVMVMAAKDYSFAPEAVRQLLELDADIERFNISHEAL